MSESILSINLKKFRRENNLTQQELAEMLDVSDKSISKWELGHTYPSKKNMINIANVLNISVELLLLEELTEENQNTKKLSKNKLISLLVIGCGCVKNYV
ncbi:helix-turn-helix domain-containing protein [Vagococcus carniphilus]|uniref:helix-turn-helix domain-containing protein n=1 Tax=Vagococcus carniphilus TaxID=218144 RepID=UPI003BAA22C0